MKENRDTFFARLEPILDRDSILEIKLAYILSKYCHRAQTRRELDENGEPLRYFEHPRRVALILLDELHCAEPVMLISAYLHDGIEDTRELDPEFIEHCFGADVSRIVTLLSKVPKEGYLERLINCTDWRALMIKAADRLDNLRTLPADNKQFCLKQTEETRKHYLPLFDKLVLDSPVGERARAIYLRSKITEKLLEHETVLNKKEEGEVSSPTNDD